MRHVEFNPKVLEDPAQKEFWKKWLAKAEAATERMIRSQESGQPCKFEERIWKELKDWLSEHVFFGNCAYCEATVEHVAPPDAEHYRPKKMVKVRVGESVVVIKVTADAPLGYYWLAYNWKNILPSCIECNRGRGKRNFFPVERVHILTYSDKYDPDTLDKEEVPLLLHPYRDIPTKHLIFGIKGIVSGMTPQGEESVETYNLNREMLKDQRDDAQRLAWMDYWTALGNSDKDQMKAILDRYVSGRKQFSTACLAKIEESMKNIPLP